MLVWSNSGFANCGETVLANDKLITIEQPELHIHQSYNLTWRIFSSGHQVQNNTFLIETHSEHNPEAQSVSVIKFSF